MVFLVIVCLDSYIYIQNNITKTLYRGVPPPCTPRAEKMGRDPIETQYDMYDVLAVSSKLDITW